ncbi:MAG: hypothetical protein UW62_C0003G0015 [Candidatus Collierbacteria bacterium GW2011_GWB1_44_35]|uniref:50S ribosomal protein L15 n=1 Tax=Candidatus Collierbacteria bacterium GW2011_GWB1_44_35 TaxID=1618383 RepID=A0A0G1LHG5_9BACT|nr:MAG: hypothetical protein UW62_C0003G0015 [Candidatus Collierbacteria bacterium GW2011_GWB1_44_35]
MQVYPNLPLRAKNALVAVLVPELAVTLSVAKLLSESLKLNEKESKRGFKIVATGKIEKPLEIAVLATAGAVKLIEKAGGKYSFAK